MLHRTAVIGDVGGHATELAALLTELGADVTTGALPEGLHVVQVGDLVHRGPDSMNVLTLVDRFLTASPDQWTQLIGNHEAQYVRPGGPTFDGYPPIDATGQELLRHWWDTHQMVVAAHVPTPGPGTIITHAGLTPGFAFGIHQDVSHGTVDAPTMVDTLNDLPRAHRDDPLWMPGLMLTGQPTLFAGPLWAEAGHELYEGWFFAQGAGPMPWDQAHGHSQAFDFTNRHGQRNWRCTPVIRDQCTADMSNRHVVFRQYSGRTITGVDPCHDTVPSPAWSALILEHRP